MAVPLGRIARFFLLSLFASSAALAIDPGVAQGWLHVGGGAAIKLTHAYVYLDRPHEMRILVADREVLWDALPRIAFSSITELARDGQLRGLLIQLDPDNPKHAVVTPLDTTVSNGSPGAMRRLSIGNNRVIGEIDSYARDAPKIAYRTTFSAPLFTNYGMTPGGSVMQ